MTDDTLKNLCLRLAYHCDQRWAAGYAAALAELKDYLGILEAVPPAGAGPDADADADVAERAAALVPELCLTQTCSQCPEQYDVARGGRVVGMLHLRHGHFTATCGGREVFASAAQGDGVFGYDERDEMLAAGTLAIALELVRTGAV